MLRGSDLRSPVEELWLRVGAIRYDGRTDVVPPSGVVRGSRTENAKLHLLQHHITWMMTQEWANNVTNLHLKA